MARRRARVVVALLLVVAAACCHKGEAVDYFCNPDAAYVYAPDHDCGAGITGFDVQGACAAKCANPGYAECPGPCVT